jgi:hypothetical protein
VPNLSNLEIVIAIVALAVPLILIPAVPRRWLGWIVLLWVLSPAIYFFGMLIWEAATRPPGGYTLGSAFYGFMLLASLLAPAWLVLCLVGIGIGFLFRRIVRRRAPVSEASVQVSVQTLASVALASPASRTPAQPPPFTMAGWRSEHVGFAQDGLTLGGRDVWAEGWRPMHEPPVHLPHPAHRQQIHRYEIFEIGPLATPVRFAASELSNGVWGFYTPTSSFEQARGSSANGAIRYEYSLGEMVGGRYDTIAAWAVVIDGATGAVLADGSAWFGSRVDPQPDGSLFLHLSVNARDTLIRLDPETCTFRDLGAGGPDRPLAELAAAVEAARVAALVPRPKMLRLSPDGTIRVEIEAVEWGNSHWVHSPRVIDVPTGRVVLDLWRTDWDATVDFTGPRRVWLSFRRYHGGGAFAAELDLARGTWRLPSEPDRAEAPLADIVAGLEEAFRVRSAGDRWIGPTIAPEPKRIPAWRMVLMVLGVMIGVIAVSLFIALYLTPPPKRPVLDRVPSFELPPMRP